MKTRGDSENTHAGVGNHLSEEPCFSFDQAGATNEELSPQTCQCHTDAGAEGKRSRIKRQIKTQKRLFIADALTH